MGSFLDPDFKDLLFLDSQILKTEAFEIIEDGLVIEHGMDAVNISEDNESRNYNRETVGENCTSNSDPFKQFKRIRNMGNCPTRVELTLAEEIKFYKELV